MVRDGTNAADRARLTSSCYTPCSSLTIMGAVCPHTAHERKAFMCQNKHEASSQTWRRGRRKRKGSGWLAGVRVGGRVAEVALR
jgi:hypothetical protein